MKAWIIICDAAKARIFAAAGLHVPLQSVEEHIHPQARVRDSEALTDRPGRVRTGVMGRSVTAMDPRRPRHDVEAERFAREVAGVLEQGYGRNAFDALALVAPPRFLGLLRGALSPQVSRAVGATLPRDYSTLVERELSERLGEVLESLSRFEFAAGHSA